MERILGGSPAFNIDQILSFRQFSGEASRYHRQIYQLVNSATYTEGVFFVLWSNLKSWDQN
jgi:hypothetical protein